MKIFNTYKLNFNYLKNLHLFKKKEKKNLHKYTFQEQKMTIFIKIKSVFLQKLLIGIT